MTIQTTLGALVTAEPALGRMAQLKLSAHAAYHIGRKLLPLVAAETKHFHDTRNAALKELGTTDDGARYTFTPEAGQEFQRREAELSDIPVELPWGPITLTMLGDSPISAADLAANSLVKRVLNQAATDGKITAGVVSGVPS